MTPQQYILLTLDTLRQPIHMDDIGNMSLEDAIYAKVTSKKFRKQKLGEDGVQLTKQAIKLFVAENKPVRLLEMFGGNKLWRFEESPEIDWAELFSFTYFAQWARYIASVYKPGVVFEYFSQDISVESLNNVPRTQTNRYSQTFRKMLEFVKPYLPENIRFKYTRHYELFKNPDDYYVELEEAKKKILEQNKGKLPEMSNDMKAATELNVKLRPGQDKDSQWREKVELEHQALFQTPTLRKVSDDPAKIWTLPTYYSDSVVTGSTKRSYAKFWAGVGALQKEGDSYAELVLTPKQLGSLKFNWEEMRIKGLSEISRNFEKVRVL